MKDSILKKFATPLSRSEMAAVKGGIQKLLVWDPNEPVCPTDYYCCSDGHCHSIHKDPLDCGAV